MNEKTIQCLPNPSQHVSIFFNNFPVIRTASAKIAVFTYHSPHFCFTWRRPCDYHAICCMDGKTVQCPPNASPHVPIYLQQSPSYSNRKCKNRRFHVPQPTYLFPLETALRLSRSVMQCNVIKTISIAQYTVQTAARALNIVNKQYTLSQTE